ncbi:MAG TPA: Na+/H+ antiporter [Arachidicoccus sp.]
MLHQFPLYLVLIVFMMLLIMLAQKIKIAYPIVLVIGGLLLSLSPSVPDIHIDHELIFIIFLPPLLYEAAWYTSWKEFWRWRRVISSFAFLIVIVTSLVVAWVASSFIPGFTLALGFLLGGIVSPPDAVSASAILKYVKVPKRMKAIIEGESLLNDASSLIVFRFALIAVDTGRFVFHEAALSFFWVIITGIAIGLLVGYIFYLTHKWLPTDVNMDIVLTLIAPYAMYLAAESIHVSGVLAVVSGGLFLSARQHEILTNTSRLRSSTVWSSLGFVLNGLVFILIGLQLPMIVYGLGTVSLKEAIGYGVLITAVLMVARILSTFGSAAFTVFASKFITTAENHPGWKGPLLFGWAGMRGVVSLAAAMSIPSLLDNGNPFPQRDLILFITFVVILLTLLVQGLTLPLMIHWLKLPDRDAHISKEEEDKRIKNLLAKESLDYLKNNFPEESATYPQLQQMTEHFECQNAEQSVDEEMSATCKNVYLKLMNKQREWLHEWNKDITTDEDLIRKHLLLLDLEEEKLKHA